MTDMVRHSLATLAYRAEKVVRDPPDGFEEFSAGAGSRSAGGILAHICDLIDWAASLARGGHAWHPRPPVGWQSDVDRLFASIRELDAVLGAGNIADVDARKVFQGPIADALTHVGQLALLRRLAGSAVKGENYARAAIRAGALGPVFEGVRTEF
jgi:hypothetical protein